MAASLLHGGAYRQQLCQWISPVCLSQKMVTVTRAGRIANSPLPLLYLTVVTVVVGTVASEHRLCWQACNSRSLLDTSKLMYKGPHIVLRWKYFSVATNWFCYLHKELAAGVFEAGGKSVMHTINDLIFIFSEKPNKAPEFIATQAMVYFSF